MLCITEETAAVANFSELTGKSESPRVILSAMRSLARS